MLISSNLILIKLKLRPQNQMGVAEMTPKEANLCEKPSLLHRILILVSGKNLKSTVDLGSFYSNQTRTN